MAQEGPDLKGLFAVLNLCGRKLMDLMQPCGFSVDVDMSLFCFFILRIFIY